MLCGLCLISLYVVVYYWHGSCYIRYMNTNILILIYGLIENIAGERCIKLISYKVGQMVKIKILGLMVDNECNKRG